MQENSTPQQLTDLARAVLDSAPCSLEMPAGTGKTHLLATAVLEASIQGKRSLVLTHTNAGVDVLRKRLKKFGVPSSAYRVDTITGFAFSLVRAYSNIGEVTVPDIPDWADSKNYIEGAIKVATAESIKSVLACSYDYFFIDEYQDCSTDHHSLVIAVRESIPGTIVLGDRLQGIFGFRDQQLVDWDEHVFSEFPLLNVRHVPHRWRDANPRLGDWLYSIRDELIDGGTIDLGSISVEGVHWIRPEEQSLADIAFSFDNFDETVVLLDKWPRTVARHASLLGGHYSVMEDIMGKFMIQQLSELPSPDSFSLASWLAIFSKECIVGLSGIDAPVLNKLQRNESISHYRRPDIQLIITQLDQLRENPSYENLVEVANIISSHDSIKVYRWEAWRDTISAITNSLASGNTPLRELALIRDKIRHAGRRPHSRIASRTLLVKGLEYDHVIIADLSSLLDPKNLYVALTRARLSIYIISSDRHIRLRDDQPF